MRQIRRWAVLMASVGAAACASAGGGPQSGPPIVIEVQNNNFRDATVYIVRDGERQRLGVVIGKTDESFPFPWRPNMVIRLEVRFLGGGACVTPDYGMDPGQRHILDLHPDIRLNTDCRPVSGREQQR